MAKVAAQPAKPWTDDVLDARVRHADPKVRARALPIIRPECDWPSLEMRFRRAPPGAVDRAR